MHYVDDLDAPQFFTADACKAAGIEQSTLKNWIVRSPPAILISEEDRASIGAAGPSHERMAGGSGRSHLFTFRRVMQIALCAELVRLGFPPRKAGLIAAGFTDLGIGSFGWVGEPFKPTKRERGPGELYANGLTILVAEPETGLGRVINVDPTKPKLWELFYSGTQRTTSAAVVNVTAVWARVIESLGLDMDWFRPEHAAPTPDEDGDQ
jgi:hypothetical protein